MVKKAQKKSIVSSALITVFIVIMLIISGPAQAVSVIISGLGGTYTKGNSINFTVSVNITDPDKYVPAANISLDVTGPVNLDRTFALNGTPILGDSAITITPVQVPQPDQHGYGYGYGVDSRSGTGYHFGYGYGYGYGNGAGGGTVTYTYNVTIDTTSLPAGSYDAVANLNTGKAAKPEFTSAHATFIISETIQVTIEISPKTINPDSNGVITVTIFSNASAGFDVADINISTVRFGRGNAQVNMSGISTNKLILKFNTADTQIQCGDTQATLTGKTSSGQDIFGSDSFRTKECSINVQLPPTDASGKTTTAVTHESPSGDMTVTIPAGTRALDKDGHPLSSITVTSLADIPSKASKKLSSKDRPVGEYVELEPSGSTFSPPIQIQFNYTEPLPDGVSESSLQIRTYNETTDSWETLPIVERNTESNYIIANVSHFSTFALIGTVSEAPPSGTAGSGGSSGGGGVITLEPYENIAKAETQEKDLVANKPVIYTFTTPELGVYELAVTGKENENDIAIRVESLKGTSKLVTSSAPGTVYKNVNIWAGTKRIEEAVIRFKIGNSWLVSNNIATGDVKVVKWNGNQWILLDTTESGKDASYTYFEANTDTFSIFAITGLKGGVLPTATPTVTQQPEKTSTSTGTATVTQTPTPEAPPVNLATIMLVIVLIAIVAVVYFKRKEIFKK